MKAIICAAGNSTRMGVLTRNTPKSLLPIIGEKTIIENLVNGLSIDIVSEIIIITGYLNKAISNRLGSHCNGVKISYVYNNEFLTTNNMYSLFLAKNKIDEDVIFVSGDVYISELTIKDFLKNPNQNSILIDNNSEYFNDNDPVKVKIYEDQIVAIDKNMSWEDINGVAIGVYRLSHDTFHKFCGIAASYIKNGFFDYGYIEPIKQLLKECNFAPHLIGNNIWFDIDTPEEYNFVLNKFKK